MKKYKVKYEGTNAEGWTRYATETIEARGLMHAHKLAGDHAKEIKHEIHSIHEIEAEVLD